MSLGRIGRNRRGGYRLINVLQPMCRAIRQRREKLEEMRGALYKQGPVAQRAGLKNQQTLSAIETGNIGELPKAEILNGIALALSDNDTEAGQLMVEWLTLAGYRVSAVGIDAQARGALLRATPLTEYLYEFGGIRRPERLAKTFSRLLEDALEQEAGEAANDPYAHLIQPGGEEERNRRG